MTSKTNLEEATRRLYEKHGDKITMFNYIRMDDDASFLCNVCGYQWKTSAQSVLYFGTGCDRCADRRNGDKLFRTYESVKEEIESWGCKLVSTEYHGGKKNLDIVFTCGHCGNMSLHNLRTLKIKTCRKCRALITLAFPVEDVIKRIENYGFKFIRFSNPPYRNNKSKIEYQCQLGHITIKTFGNFSASPFCKECRKKEKSEKQIGSKGPRWNKGVSGLSMLLEKRIDDWKQASMKQCNYKCIITGDHFDHIHHLYPMTKIINEVFNNLSIEKKRIVGKYSDEELSAIINETQRLHTIYPMGVCLRKDVHNLFHSKEMYGNRNFTPEDFYEFQSRIQSGEIQIPD